MQNSSVGYFDIGLNFSLTNRYEEAIEFFTKAIAIDEFYSEAYGQRAVAYLKLNDYESFLEDNNKAISLDPESHGAYFSLFDYYLTQKDYLKAQDALLKCLEICPDNHTYAINLSMIYSTNKLWDNVLLITKKILKNRPEDFLALKDKAYAHLYLKEYGSAAILFKRLITMVAPSFRNNYKLNIGFCLLQQGNYEESIVFFNQVIAEQEHAYAYNNRGFAKHKLNRNKEALIDINKSLAIDSSNSYAYKNKAIILLSEGKKEDALKDLMIAKELGYEKYYDNEVDVLLSEYFG